MILCVLEDCPGLFGNAKLSSYICEQVKKIFLILLFMTTQVFAEEKAEELSWPAGWKTHYGELADRGSKKENLMILGAGVALSLVFLPFDDDLTEDFKKSNVIGRDLEKFGSWWGAGFPTGMIALGQLLFDYENGIAHVEAGLYSQLTSGSIKTVLKRDRPDPSRGDKSFPSGHTATATAAAVSLWRSYGWKVGAPMSALAVVAGLARISEGVHYPSDVAMGAAIGLYWGLITSSKEETELRPYFDLSRGVIGWEYKY